MERLETRKNPNDPDPTSVKITRVIPSGTGTDKIPVNADGQPLDPAEYRARLEGLERSLALMVDNNRAEREAMEKYAKRRKDRNEVINATRNAFRFTLLGREPRGDRMLAKYELSPNPTFKPTSRFTAILTRVHGYVWIDETARKLARSEEHTSELQSRLHLVCRLLLEKKKQLSDTIQMLPAKYYWPGKHCLLGLSKVRGASTSGWFSYTAIASADLLSCRGRRNAAYTW